MNPDTLPIGIHGLRAGYGGTEILSGIDLSLSPGSHTLLLGPNGAGKTTLLRCILGLLAPAGGSVRLWGKSPSDPSTRTSLLRRVGASLESPTLPPRVRAGEWLEHFARLAGVGEPRREARELLRRWDIPERTDAERLSQGQRQRLLTVRCLLHRPKLLVLDEPAAHLDPGAREEFWTFLESWRKAHGAALLVSSHQLEEAADRGGDWVVLGRGRILHTGPASNFTREFPGTRSLRLDRPLDAGALEQILSSTGCSVVECAPGPSTEFRLRPARGAADQPAVARAIVDAGLGIVSLGEDSTSLREAYKACLGEEPSPTRAAAAAVPGSGPQSPPSAISDILSCALLHGKGLARERRMLLPYAVLTATLCGGILLAMPPGAPASPRDALLALASFLPCGLAAALAADLVAGERERHGLESLLALPTPYRRILAGGALSVFALGQILSTLAVLAAAAALARTGNTPDPLPFAAIALLVSPAGMAVSVATGAAFSLRSASVRTATQLSTLSTLPLLALSQMFPFLLPGPIRPWIALALGLFLAATLLCALIGRKISPERILR